MRIYLGFGLWLGWFGLALFPLYWNRNLRLHSWDDNCCSSRLFQGLIYWYFLHLDACFGSRSWFCRLACKVDGDDLLAWRSFTSRAILWDALSLILSSWLLLDISWWLLVREALLVMSLLGSTFDTSQKLRRDRDVRFGLGLLGCDHLGFHTAHMSRR